MKTKLKHILNVEANKDTYTGKETFYMVWSPVHHYWIYPEKEWGGLSKKEKRFLLKQTVVKIGLRNTCLNHIAIFLKDYGKKKNRKYRKKIKTGY